MIPPKTRDGTCWVLTEKTSLQDLSSALLIIRRMADYRHYMHHLEEIDEWEDVNARRVRKYVERRDPFSFYTNNEFLARYRLSKECARVLLEEIQEQLPVSHNRRGLRISPELQLLATLRYLATGDYQLTLADCSDMSQPSVCRIVMNVSAAIASLAQDYIKFPNPAAEGQVMQDFSAIAGMPGVIGCIDGTHVPIISPGGPNAEIYRCRKNHFSINVMGVCDASLKFTNIAVNWPGSAHDSRIFNESRLSEALEGGRYHGFLLGDSGYACRSYLLTPFLTPQTEKERHYNAAHIKTRNVIERAFGILKKRFAILSIPVRTRLPNTKNIIVACVVLYNIAIINRLPLGEDVDVFENPEFPQHLVDEHNQRGQARRADQG